MKIYLFCPETGLYHGETFADPPVIATDCHELPTGSTTIAPPKYGEGEMPVFVIGEGRWTLQPLRKGREDV